jgi:hypothetical protein
LADAVQRKNRVCAPGFEALRPGSAVGKRVDFSVCDERRAPV